MFKIPLVLTISLLITAASSHVASHVQTSSRWSRKHSRDIKEQKNDRKPLQPRQTLIPISSNLPFSIVNETFFDVPGANEEIPIDDLQKTHHIDFMFKKGFNHGSFTPSGWMYFKRDLRGKAKRDQLAAKAMDDDPIGLFQYRAKSTVVGPRSYFLMVKAKSGDMNPSPTWRELNMIIDFLNDYQAAYNAKYEKEMGNNIPGADFEFYRVNNVEGKENRLKIAEGYFEKEEQSVAIEIS